MARMIPDRSPLDVHSLAERALYLALREGLDADWRVLHSLCWTKEEGAGLREGECDFLVFHPRHGLLALEVKSGAPSFVRGEWRHADGHRLADPCAQARRAIHHLADRLRERVPEWARLQPPFGWAVAFPDADRVVGALPPHLAPQMVLLEPDLRRMQPAVEAALAAWKQPGAALGADGCRRVLDVLQPAFRLQPSLRATLRQQRETLIRLGRHQAAAFEMIGHQRRLIVEGRAGSGKTLLALRKGIDLAAAGREVLLLCFNRPLMLSLQRQADGGATSLEITTFHDLCRGIVEAVAGPAAFTVPPEPEAARRFWDEELPGRALDGVAAWPRRFDAVLVDEGQDFHDDWWLLVEALLRDEAASQLAILLDPRQDLYGSSRQLPFTEPRHTLPYNCRNSRPIAEWVAARGDLAADLADQPDGEPVLVLPAADAEAEREAVRKLLHEWVRVRGLPADSVVVLGKRRLGNTGLAGRKLGSFRLVELEDAAGPDDVRYATVHRFKGLEADAVILVGCQTAAAATDPAAAALERKLQYVGGSRARSLLCVVERTAPAPGAPL